MVAILAVLLEPVIYFLPNAVLSSIIIMSVSKLVDFAGAKALWKQDKSDLAVRDIFAVFFGLRDYSIAAFLNIGCLLDTSGECSGP